MRMVNSRIGKRYPSKNTQKPKMKKIPAVLSYHAGTFLCNYIYYIALHNARKHRTKVGFVHIPHITELIVENPEYPSLPKKALLESVKIILKETIKNNRVLIYIFLAIIAIPSFILRNPCSRFSTKRAYLSFFRLFFFK